MDIQYVCSPYECISYIASYVTKDEREMGQILQAAASEASSGNIRQQLNKIGHKFLTHRELSAQEATFRILSLPLKRSSTDVVYVATGFPVERLRLLKPKKDLQDMDGTSQDIFVSNMIERYKYRPHTVDDMCLASFVSNYKIQSVKDTADSDHVNILETDEVSESKLILLENHGVVRKRIKPAVVRTHRYSQDKESERYYHSSLMLYSPWRYEEIDLKGQFSSYEEMYVSKKDEIDTMRSAFEHNSDIIDEVLDDPDHFQNEDVWDQLAPSAQQQKAHDQASSPEIDENFPLYPDPEHSHNLEYPTHDIEINKQLIPDDEYMAIIRTLNSAQKAVFDFILNWCSCVVHSRKEGSKPDPFHIFMSGGAGTGKSHVIKAIFQMVKRILRVEGDDPDDPTIILTAPTGTAAFNIEGVTIHHGLSLPCEKTNRYISLSSNKLNTLRCKFLNLQIIVIDEISMVGCNMLYTIHRRLSDIKGCKDIFGGVSILAVGDLSQLPPIGDPPIYRQPSDPYAALYGSLWQNHFKIICLTEIMRQRENKEFAELLNRIRSNETTPQDIELLQTRCFEAQECPLDILYEFTTNDAVNAHNTRMLQTLTTPKLLVKAIDSKKDVDTSCVDVEVPEKHTKSGGLRKELTIAVGARVMVTKNVDTDDGIVNGSVGTVVGYLPEPTPDGFDSFQPKYILVQFDNPSVGEKRKQQLSLHLQNFPSAVPIGRETVKFTVGKRHIRSERTQFPLTLSWACTIHKVQGLTVPKIAVSFKGTFRDGQAYVALSRVQKLADLFLLDFKKQAIRVSNEVIEERKRMVSTSSLDLKDLFMNTRLVDIHTESISFGYVNIRSLKAHLLDIQFDANFSQCAISCFTETWLRPTDNFSSFELNQRVFRKDRSEVFQETPENAAFLSHGGLLAVASENLCPTNTSDAYPSQELECLSFHVAQPVPFTTLLVYKSPTMPKQIFLNKLNIVLKQIKGSLILIGDFNINMMNKSASKSFRTLTTTHQLNELFEQPTHATGSQLDNVFTRALHVRPLLNRPVHFSDHNALFFTIQPLQSSHQHM